MALSPISRSRPSPSLNALQVFRCAAHKRSFKAAAESLGVTPAVITRRIRQLEEYYGVGLFLRSHRRVTLTADGEVLFETVEGIFNSLCSAAHTIQRKYDRRAITILCEHDFAFLWLLPRLNALRMVVGDRLIELRTIVGDTSVESADLVIHYEQIERPYFDVQRLNQAILFPIWSPSAGCGSVARSTDPKYHTFVHNRGFEEWAMFEDSISSSSVPLSLHQVVCDGSCLCLSLIESGGVLGIGDDLLAGEHVITGRVDVPIKKFVKSPSSYYMYARRDAQQDPYFISLQQWLIANIKESVRRTHGFLGLHEGLRE